MAFIAYQKVSYDNPSQDLPHPLPLISATGFKFLQTTSLFPVNLLPLPFRVGVLSQDQINALAFALDINFPGT